MIFAPNADILLIDGKGCDHRCVVQDPNTKQNQNDIITEIEANQEDAVFAVNFVLHEMHRNDWGHKRTNQKDSRSELREMSEKEIRVWSERRWGIMWLTFQLWMKFFWNTKFQSFASNWTQKTRKIFSKISHFQPHLPSFCPNDRERHSTVTKSIDSSFTFPSTFVKPSNSHFCSFASTWTQKTRERWKDLEIVEASIKCLNFRAK